MVQHGSMQGDMVLEQEFRVFTSRLTGNRKWSGSLDMT